MQNNSFIFMLPWLVSLSFEVNQIDLWRDLKQDAPGQIDYCMNIAPRNFLSLTNNQNSPGMGTRAYFRIYDSDGAIPKPWHQLKSSNRIINQGTGKKFWENITEGWRIEFDVHKISDKGALEPHYYISNNGQQDFTFDLFIYTPINFGNKAKNAELKLIENGDVVHVDGGNRHMYFHIKKTPWAMNNPAYDYFGDVDKIYMGPTINDEDLLIKTQEKDSNYTPHDGEETALGFTWYKHLVKSGDTNRFGFKIHPTADFERLPLIKDVTPLHETYPDPYNVTFNLTSYNNKTVRAGWSRIQYRQKTWCAQKFTPHDGITTGSINCSIPFEGSNVSTFYAVAEEIDDKGNKLLTGWEMFSPITRHKFGSLRPVLNLTTEPNESYSATDNVIYIDGYVNDENFVQFYYQYDAYNITKGDYFSTAAEFQQLYFQTSIPIPSTLPLGTNHTIKIWVEDDQGLLSKVYNKTFKYGDAGKPFARNVYLSDERLIQNSEKIQLVVYGDGVYTADGKTAKVYLQVDDKKAEEIATFTSSNYPEPFAGFYDFTPGPAAHHTFKVFAREEADKTSTPEKFATTTLIVWDPNAAQPSINIGKFVDKSSAISSPAKSLFNLHYIDINEQEWNMTYNDEGFYCKFRTFNDSFTTSPIKEYDLVHTSNGITEADDFIIHFSIATDPGTNFTLAKFNVTNKRYFERKFHLSVLSDSELTDSEKTITYDSTSGKIVVNSTEQYVSYTVFTHGFNGSPTPDKIYAQPSGRNEDDSIDTKNFWKNKQQQKATAYGMSWMNTVIPGKGSLEYTITFAAFGNVKNPTRLVDKTVWKDTYNPSSTNDKINIVFEDYDGNENITLKVTENGNEQSYPWSVKDPFDQIMNFTKARDSVYTVSVQAFDIDTMTRYPSNKIEKTIYLKEKPQLSLTRPEKMFYSTCDDYVVQGNITGPATLNAADICYKHYLHHPDGQWSPSAEMCTMKGTNVGTPFTLRIKMDEIWPLSDDQWKVQIYAKDGELKSDDQNFTFNLNPYNPPTLKKAGLSKKAAHQGEFILGYVVVNHNANDKLEIYVSIDNKENKSFPEKCAYFIDRTTSSGEDKPFAFYWTVPINIKAGTHEIYFMVKDSEGIESEVYGPKFITIAA